MLTPENVLITTIDDSARLQLLKKAKHRKHIRIRIQSQAEELYKQCNTDRTSTALNILTHEQLPSRFSKYRELCMTPSNRTELNLFWKTLSLTNKINDENKTIKQKLKEYDLYDRTK
jgi:hypothetical protein